MTRIAVTGVGAVTAFGRGVDALWLGALSGDTAIGEVPGLAAAGLAHVFAAALPGGTDDPVEAEIDAARTAIAEALGGAKAPALCWASGLDGITLDGALRRRSSVETFAAVAAGFDGPVRRVATACAAGSHAIAEAARLLRAGRADRCIAGGSSVMTTPLYTHGLGQLGVLDAAACRPFDRRRAGISLGDGAGALLVERLDDARARGARIIAELVGIGTTHDAHDFFKPREDGRGAAAALRMAIAERGEIAAVIAHATGTVTGDLAEVTAMRTVLGAELDRIPVCALKGATGHTMMAAGALGTIMAALIASRRVVPPTAGLGEVDPRCMLDHVIGVPRTLGEGIVISNAFGMGGHNVVLALAGAESR